jgi:hypothetical protein
LEHYLFKINKLKKYFKNVYLWLLLTERHCMVEMKRDTLIIPEGIESTPFS